MEHELKTIQPFFNEVLSGSKTFEIRKFDRDYKIGDFLKLREYNQNTKTYEPNWHYVQITYILSDAKEYGLMDGYCILGIKNN